MQLLRITAATLSEELHCLINYLEAVLTLGGLVEVKIEALLFVTRDPRKVLVPAPMATDLSRYLGYTCWLFSL